MYKYRVSSNAVSIQCRRRGLQKTALRTGLIVRTHRGIGGLAVYCLEHIQNILKTANETALIPIFHFVILIYFVKYDSQVYKIFLYIQRSYTLVR